MNILSQYQPRLISVNVGASNGTINEPDRVVAFSSSNVHDRSAVTPSRSGGRQVGFNASWVCALRSKDVDPSRLKDNNFLGNL